ncbi:MAG: hypothetical protein M1831_007079 [Alyxoria varia]|nr:MAG: hypothetical protein M1831_007079 [Alyxoria varia]
MDPLSITGVVVAVLHLTSSSVKAFKDLRAICKTLPGRLHALQNEVADIDLVFHEVNAVAEDRQSDPAFVKHVPALSHLLRQAYAKLLDIRTITRKLIEVCNSAQPNLFNAFAWKKNQPRLQLLQEELQTIKCSFNVILGTIHSHDLKKIHIDLEGIFASTSSSSQQTTNLYTQLDEKLDVHHNSINGALDAIYQRFDQRIGDVEHLLSERSVTLRDRQFQQIGPSYGAAASLNTLRQSKKTPMATLTGSRKAGGEAFKTKEGQDVCILEYWFPLSFVWSQILRFQLAYNPNIGPRFELSTLRRVPDSASCVHLALSGDIEGLKDLFNRGLASPRDVSSTRGYSLLRWAVYGHQYKAARFLMRAGADPDYRPIAPHDNSPRHKANQFLLMGGIPDEDADALRTLTEGSDFVEEQNYTNIHNIILGFLSRDLEQELTDHPELLDVPDAMGRTPLTWAACRGDERAIISLLKRGAEVNTMDVQHTNAVSYAAERDFVVCVRLLLEAGANPNIAQAHGLQVADAINVAARNASDNLLDFGANPNATGVDRMTSLIHAARRDNASFALLLLENHADINATSTANQTPLTTAVTYNSHNVLRLLLDRWFEYSECPRLKSPHLLKLVAQYADVETMKILASTDHLLMKHDKDYTLGDFRSALESRLDADDMLLHEFDELLIVIKQGLESSRIPSHCPTSHSPAMMESGLLSNEEAIVEEMMLHATERNNESDSDDAFENANETFDMPP